MQNAEGRDSGVLEGMRPQMPRIGSSVGLSGPLTKRRSAKLAAPPYLRLVWRSHLQLVRMRH
eukprot:6213006-Pleurochrysis_carterae.AAC.2